MIGYLVLVPADQQPRCRSPSNSPAPADAAVEADPLVRIDPVQRTAEVDGRSLDLTYLEFELLTHLVAHPHRVHTRDQLVTTVWGYGHVGDGRTVDVHVARLRRKLGRSTGRRSRRYGGSGTSTRLRRGVDPPRRSATLLSADSRSARRTVRAESSV